VTEKFKTIFNKDGMICKVYSLQIAGSILDMLFNVQDKEKLPIGVGGVNVKL
jgi:hypothetical protein